ncbi:type III secretion system chaperone [Robbsia sp. KACC 23696]|uniref:type III secretion system chaperone n=1 Tax=Robbsia sp. KACC 23696 TaxID=3149231 RepID=UPI00325BF005
MTYAEVLALLHLEDRMDVQAAIRSGSCSVTFDTDIDVTLEMAQALPGMPDPSAPQLLVYTTLGTLAKAHREIVFARLLQLHLFGVATSQGVFGFDDVREQVLFFRHIALSQTEPEGCAAGLHRFLEQARRWRDALPALQRWDNEDRLSPETERGSMNTFPVA